MKHKKNSILELEKLSKHYPKKHILKEQIIVNEIEKEIKKEKLDEMNETLVKEEQESLLKEKEIIDEKSGDTEIKDSDEESRRDMRDVHKERRLFRSKRNINASKSRTTGN